MILMPTYYQYDDTDECLRDDIVNWVYRNDMFDFILYSALERIDIYSNWGFDGNAEDYLIRKIKDGFE